MEISILEKGLGKFVFAGLTTLIWLMLRRSVEVSVRY